MLEYEEVLIEQQQNLGLSREQVGTFIALLCREAVVTAREFLNLIEP